MGQTCEKLEVGEAASLSRSRIAEIRDYKDKIEQEISLYKHFNAHQNPVEHWCDYCKMAKTDPKYRVNIGSYTKAKKHRHVEADTLAELLNVVIDEHNEIISGRQVIKVGNPELCIEQS